MTRIGALVMLTYVALTAVLTYPLSLHPGSRILSPSTDTNLVIWLLAWDSHAFVHQPFSIFEANIFYPFHLTLAYAENLIGMAFFAAPVLWLSKNYVLAFNVASLVTPPLCAAGAYLLARSLGVGRVGAFVAGLAYGFSPARFLRLDQMHLTAVHWIPFSLAFTHRYLDEGRPRDVKLAIAFFTLQALSSGHGAVFLTTALVLVIVYRVAFGERIDLVRRVHDVGWIGVLLLLPAILVVIPYRRAQVDMGLRRSLGDWAMTTSSYFTSPTHVDQFLAPWLIPSALMQDTPWAYLFPGYLPIALAAIAVVPAFRLWAGDRSRAWRRIAFALEILAVACLAFAVYATAVGGVRIKLGSWVLSARQLWRPWLIGAVLVALRVGIGERAPFAPVPRIQRGFAALMRWREAQRRSAFTVYLFLTVVSIGLALGPPYGLWQYVYWWPGMSFIRVSSRFIVLVVLGLAVLAGLGADRIASRLGSATSRFALAAILCALLAAEFALIPLQTYAQSIDIPQIDRWLGGQPKPFVVAEVPVVQSESSGARDKRQSEYVTHSMAHWQKTIHGYSGLTPPLSEELFEKLLKFPDQESLNSLADLGVTYVVVHTEHYSHDEWKRIESRLQDFSAWLSLARVEGTGRAYRLVRPAR